MNRLEALLERAAPELRKQGLIKLEDGQLVAHFPGGRTQRISAKEHEGQWHFETRVASRAIVMDRGRERVALQILERNRIVPVVSFDLDGRSRLVARVTHPAETLQSDEVWLLLLTLAREADRWEHQLTGRDRH
jgi:hypothetical protein